MAWLRQMVSGVGIARMVERASGWAPGLLLAASIALISVACAQWIAALWLAGARSPISPVTLALVFGLLVGNVHVWPRCFDAGLRFAAVTLLRLGIVLLGLQLSVVQVVQVGVVALPIVGLVMVTALVVGVGLASALRLPPTLGLLIAVGTSICGVSAIAATGPTIQARREEVAYAIAVITLFGLAATLIYPVAVPWLVGLDSVRMGIFLGAAIHDTSQVSGAALMVEQLHGEEAVVQTAIVTKLLRNAAMAIVLPLAALWAARGQAVAPLAVAFPPFVLGFLLLAALRTGGDALLVGDAGVFGAAGAEAWMALQRTTTTGASALMVVALAALGVNTRVRDLRGLGMRPLAVGFLTAAAVAGVAWGFIVAWVAPVTG